MIEPVAATAAHRRMFDAAVGAMVVLFLSIQCQEHEGGAEPRKLLGQLLQLNGGTGIDAAGVVYDMSKFFRIHQSRATAAKIC